VSYPARLPGGEVGDGLNNRYDMILLNKSGLCVTHPHALVSGRNWFFDKSIQYIEMILF
jgi:hypothetical protein